MERFRPLDEMRPFFLAVRSQNISMFTSIINAWPTLQHTQQNTNTLAMIAARSQHPYFVLYLTEKSFRFANFKDPHRKSSIPFNRWNSYKAEKQIHDLFLCICSLPGQSDTSAESTAEDECVLDLEVNYLKLQHDLCNYYLPSCQLPLGVFCVLKYILSLSYLLSVFLR